MKGAQFLFSHILVNFQNQNAAPGYTHAALDVAVGSFLHVSAKITWALKLSNCSNIGGGRRCFSLGIIFKKMLESYYIHLKPLNVHIRSSHAGHLPWKRNFPGQNSLKIFYYRNILFRP